MCDDASPCDLKAIPLADRTDDFDRWSIEQAERLHPHYRYKIVCSKWGFQRVLGQGYRYGVARALSGVLMDMCSHARRGQLTKREKSYAKPRQAFAAAGTCLARPACSGARCSRRSG